tara:strand:- start:348 stop:623 length:276 start_codon:yes stop_codon:yes gene_type:complete
MSETKEIQEQTFNVSVKSLLSIGTILILMIGEYLVLQEEINEAKLLPKPEISRIEIEMQNEIILQRLTDTQADVNEIKADLKKIHDKLNNK